MNKGKKAGILRSTLAKTPIREGSVRERSWDIRSDISDGPVHHHHARQIENTYKVNPDADKKFKPGVVEHIMHDVLVEFLTDVEYDKTLGQRMSKMLADTIKTRVKDFRWARYKIVVQVIIGENKEQDVRAGSRFLWYDETDNFASTTFVNKSLFALAICFGVYFE